MIEWVNSAMCNQKKNAKALAILEEFPLPKGFEETNPMTTFGLAAHCAKHAEGLLPSQGNGGGANTKHLKAAWWDKIADTQAQWWCFHYTVLHFSCINALFCLVC